MKLDPRTAKFSFYSSVMGMFTFYQNFIPPFASLVEPLQRLRVETQLVKRTKRNNLSASSIRVFS